MFIFFCAGQSQLAAQLASLSFPKWQDLHFAYFKIRYRQIKFAFGWECKLGIDGGVINPD